MNTLLHELSALNILKQNGKFNSHAQKILDKHPSVMADVLQHTNFLREDAPLRERLTCIRDGITQQPTCKYCDKHVKFNQARAEYGTYCGAKCSRSDPIVKQKVKDTFMKNYGVDNCAKHPKVKAKRSETNQNRYGVDYPLQNRQILEQTHNTMQHKHGGVGFASDIIQQKAKQAVWDKYGTNCIANPPLSQHAEQCLNDKSWLIENHHILQKSLTKISTELDVSIKTVSKYCQFYDVERRNYWSSQAERDIGQYLQQKGFNIQTNVRHIIDGELDILIPSHNIAIEYDGLFWHSEQQGKGKNYHLNKTLRCQKNGIQLIHIFEDEWVKRPDIVYSRLLSKLSSSATQRIFARKCDVRLIDNKSDERFFNDNHIQGHVSANVSLGLYYDNRLIACMSFCKSRFNKNYQYELLRYATLQNTTVVGGSQKLLKRFEQQFAPSSIITYSDKRWNTGDMYIRLGFNYTHSSQPNYFYIINGHRHTRINYQKHKLQNKLPLFDSNLTEYQNMLNNGYDRIWDCGNDVFVKQY